MGETITSSTVDVELPGPAIAEELTAALHARGLHAEPLGEGEAPILRVRYTADEPARLLADVTHAIEGWLGEQETPLVVQHANGRCLLRPPGS